MRCLTQKSAITYHVNSLMLGVQKPKFKSGLTMGCMHYTFIISYNFGNRFFSSSLEFTTQFKFGDLETKFEKDIPSNWEKIVNFQ